jgi:hypothetical protein
LKKTLFLVFHPHFFIIHHLFFIKPTPYTHTQMVHQFSGSETRPPSSSSKCASLSLSDLVLRNALASSGPKSFFFDGYGNMVIVIPPTPRVPELSIRLIDKKPRKRPLAPHYSPHP